MSLHAFTMKLRPGTLQEYKRRHDAIWPELVVLLRESGISDYSIFLDEASLVLFAVQRRTHPDCTAGLPDHPVMKKWWAYMAPLMETNPDQSPRCVDLQQVFHLD